MDGSQFEEELLSQFEEELLSHWFLRENQRIVQRDERWTREYMPAFRAYYEKNKSANVPQSHPVLGRLVNAIRICDTAIPPQFEEELFSLGFDVRNQHTVQREERWTREYMPAFHAYYEENENVNVPRTHPVLGTLVNAIRVGRTEIPVQFQESLYEMGLFLCTSNVAKHVAMRLGRIVESIDADADAQRVVNQVARIHARMLKRRVGLKGIALKRAGLRKVPFGIRSIGNGVDRCAADLRRMESTDDLRVKM